MPSTKEFLCNVIEKINYSLLFDSTDESKANYKYGSGSFGEAIITFRPMMGEYLIYCDGTYFGGVYDNRFMIKPTDENERFCLEKDFPYDGAKPMYLVKDLNNPALLAEMVFTTVQSLKNAGAKSKKQKNSTSLPK